MSREAAQSLTYLEVRRGTAYYYLCPFNDNLEQGMDTNEHICNAVSANRYRIVYHANAGEEVYGGYMAPSFHMYGNATEYEGVEVTPQTHLNKNTYTRIGWEFVGWNTEIDGSGKEYGDETEIYNLSDENYQGGDYDEDATAGTVNLYAVWRRSVSVLEIDPAGGAYDENVGISSIQGNYGESCQIPPEKVTAPMGFSVSFETNGGNKIDAVRGTQSFVEWRQNSPFRGKLQSNIYSFCAPDGNVDRVTAVYSRNAITLPQPVKANQSFGGWYYDEEFQHPAGGSGDKIIPTDDITLYAQWVELLLTSVDNYEDNAGAGAVDLTWSQPDGTTKNYKLYQSRDGESWEQILAADDIESSVEFEAEYTEPKDEEICTVPYYGLYSISAAGAQGADYGERSGGMGGEIFGKFWLQAGDKLTIGVGGQDGTNGGGIGEKYGNGGGYSIVKSAARGILLIAGGGGGAGSLCDGNQGGSEQSVMEEGNAGENGASGGGGGYLGGHAGIEEVHNHVEGVCNHVHTGDSSKSGGCYTVAVKCGEKLNHVFTGTEKWYWGGLDESYCPNCGTDNCKGHERDCYKHVCPVHGTVSKNNKSNSPSVCTKTASYAPGCGKTEEYICGYPYDGYVISAQPSSGGSSYVNKTAAQYYDASAGVREGDGYVKIVAEDVGYWSLTAAEGVTARDMDAPDCISMDSVTKTPLEENTIQVQWQKPKDNGTVYYHKAESYALGSTLVLSESNITMNTLTSGVNGYWYCVDSNPDTRVNGGNGEYLSDTGLQVTLSDADLYIHIATVDLAGNISGTTHIYIGSKTKSDEDILWPVFTRQLLLGEGDNIYPAAEENTYYVKSDGCTAFRVEFGAYMQGPASEGYQINYGVIESNGKSADWVKNLVCIPSGTVDDNVWEMAAESLGFSMEGEGYINNGSYVVASRSNRCKNLSITRDLLLSRDADGKKIRLIPRAGAEYKDETVYSARQMDIENSIWVIGDGEPPEIDGLEELVNLPLIDRRQEVISLQVSAFDALSGVRELYLEIDNLDNGATKYFYPDETGVIGVDICEDEPIFSGDFNVTAYACDNVGNNRTLEYGTTEFDLQAAIERVLAPHEPEFKRGESGILHIESWGYAERIEIIFPEELSSEDESLNHVYVYDLTPAYKQEEDYEFMIPLYVTENTDYTVTVRAYKGDKMLERHPALAVLGVEGTVLDELRTRLR
jgi:hypothetical protein